MLDNGAHFRNFDTKFYEGKNDRDSFIHSIEDSNYIFANTDKGDKELDKLKKTKHVSQELKDGDAKIVRMTGDEIYDMYKDRITAEHKLNESTRLKEFNF